MTISLQGASPEELGLSPQRTDRLLATVAARLRECLRGRDVLARLPWNPHVPAVPLRATAYRLLPGERLRVAVACADFPRIWPTPVAAEPSTWRCTCSACRSSTL